MLKNMIAGVLMGLANIIPGVSGGTMAVSMGIYDKLIGCISNLFKDFKKSILFLLPIFIGMGIAIVGSAFGIDYLYENFPIQTNLLFIGLILGSLPLITKNVKGKKMEIGHIITCLVFFCMVVGLALLDGKEGNAANLSFNVINIVKLFGVGIIASATMVVPGVSGSMMLLLLGYYNPILSAIKNFMVAFFSFDIPGIIEGCGILIPFGIGVVFGIFAIAKIIEKIFEKFPLYAYFAIIGLILASPVGIIILASFPPITIGSGVTGIIALGIGGVIALKLGD